jgi:hypothetical protein
MVQVGCKQKEHFIEIERRIEQIEVLGENGKN